MPIPQNKTELLNEIIVNYKNLNDALLNIPIELTNKKELEGHAKTTLMSIHNLISYLIGWQELVLKWNLKKQKGVEVHFPEEGFKWNELGLLAQKFYKDYENEDFNSLKIKLDKATRKIIKLVKSKTNEELYKTPWYEKYTLGRMIQLNTSSPFKNAKDRIRKWKKLNG